MEFFKDGTVFDVMKIRYYTIGISLFLVIASVVLVFYPGPNWGIDFRGGTELQLQFKGTVSAGELRQTLEQLGYDSPDVVSVAGKPNQYIIRVSDVSALDDAAKAKIRNGLRGGLEGVKPIDDPTNPKFSPGGDKITIQYDGAVEPEALRAALEASGASVRAVNAFGKPGDFRYEAQLVGVGEEMVRKLSTKLGDRAPEAPLRVEWVGPKAGKQLRDSALQSLLYAIGFIMLYVAFRFDLRFAPGGVIALVHDATVTIGFLVLLQREITLTTVAALLTVIGYSLTDSIAIYDRIRENMQRMRTKSLYDLINISNSQTLSRTLLTATTVLISISAFFVWGTPVLFDFALALSIGLLAGAWSSIFLSGPSIDFMDRWFFRKARLGSR